MKYMFISDYVLKKLIESLSLIKSSIVIFFVTKPNLSMHVPS